MHYTLPEHALPFNSAFSRISTVGSSLIKLEPHTLVIYQYSISEHCCIDNYVFNIRVFGRTFHIKTRRGENSGKYKV